MTRRQSIARFLAARAARIILAGSDPADAPENPASQVNDILLSNLVVREDASNGLVGYLYAIGTPAAVTFSITVDADGIFSIVNGNELHKVDAFGTGADYAITIKATETVSGAEYSEAFTIDVIPAEDEEDDSGIGGGGGSGDVEVPDDEDPDADTDPYVEPPVEVVTEIAAKVSGKTGGTSVFLKDWGVPVAGRVYVMKYSADWSGMSALGAYAAVGFGFKHGNNFHMVALRGNGAASTTMLGSRLYGDFRKSKQFTITNDGAATHGTKNGPNWLRLTVAGDGSTYTLESSSDGVTWASEIADVAAAPLASVTTATQFGPAAYFYEEDKGPFVISITEFWQKPVFTADPEITGTPTEGETLTLSDGTVVGAGVTLTRQWKRDGANISAATNTTYVLQAADVGTDITGAVTATNDGGATTATSDAVGPIASGSYTNLLDLVSATSTGGYSVVRKLKDTYSGSAFRVRRSSDNTEQDIGFGTDEGINQAALLAFCGAGNGFVVTLYNQDGNASRDFTMATASFQPQIVSSGAVITVNGEPAMQFDGSNDHLDGPSMAGLIPVNAFTVMVSCRPTAGGTDVPGASFNNPSVVGNMGVGYYGININSSVPQVQFYSYSGSQDSTEITTPALPYTGILVDKRASNTHTVYVNGGTGASEARNQRAGDTDVAIGRGYNGTTPFFTGFVQEVVFFTGGLSTADINTLGADMAAISGPTWTTI
jgi:hypothetical protein